MIRRITMKISTKGRYALRLLLDLMDNENTKPVKIKDISERQGVSEKYLEQIVSALHKSGYVKSTRGALGGYRIAFDPNTTTVGEILRVTEKTMTPVDCENCERAEECKTKPLWAKLGGALDDTLNSITLADLQNGDI